MLGQNSQQHPTPNTNTQGYFLPRPQQRPKVIIILSALHAHTLVINLNLILWDLIHAGPCWHPQSLLLLGNC